MVDERARLGGDEGRLKIAWRKVLLWGAVFLVLQATAGFAAYKFFIAVGDYKQIRGELTLRHFGKDGRLKYERKIRNLIVNAGENFMVDAFQNTTELENLRFHGIGTGATAAGETDTGCQTELTTQYNPDNTRATGSLTEGASTNIYRTVGTNTVDAAVAITEFCLMSQAATGGGTMWSRVVFSAINLASGDSLQTTYDLTVE